VVIARGHVIAMVVGIAIFVRPADAAPARVPMVLVDPPPAFDTARFVTSLETYVTNAVIEASSRVPATDDIVCAEVIAEARAAAVSVALWARWVDRTMTVSMVTVDKGCAAAESSTVDVPPEQPEFVYRVSALKIASLLRVLPETRVVVEDNPSGPEVGQARNPLPWSLGSRIRPTYDGAVELGATGVASSESAARTFALVASAWVNTRSHSTRFSVGATLLASAAHEADAAGGSGRTRVFGASLGGRAILIRGERAALVGQLDLGVLSIWSSADRTTGASAMSETVWAPVVSLAPHVRIAVAGPLHVTLGPTLDLSRPVLLTLGQTPLYQASWLRFRWDIRAQLWF